MKTLSLCLVTLIAFTVNGSLQKRVDLEREKAELLEIHKEDRRAHFSTDVELLLSRSSEDFITVSEGKVYRVKTAESKAMFDEYFKDAAYQEWDDLEPPIVRVSNDASMAWMIVRTKVSRTQKNSMGQVKKESFVYAGIMTYEKRDGKWVRVANVTTLKRG
jgi:D-serine deaminase-like pyridoxal phosphate-dependent protein